MDTSVVTLLTITTVSAPSFPALTDNVTPPFISSFDIPPLTEDNLPTSDQGSITGQPTSINSSPTYGSTTSSLPFPSITPTTPAPISSFILSITTPSLSFAPTSKVIVSTTLVGAISVLSTAEAPTPSEFSSPNNSLISKGGIIGLALALGVLFLGSIVLFWCYRHQKHSHAKAMLIAPRLSGNMERDVSEMREGSRQVDTEAGDFHRIASSHEPMDCLQDLTTYRETPTRRRLWKGTVGEQKMAQQGLVSEPQDLAETPATHKYKSREEYLEACRTPLHWHEAFDRLDEFQKNLSPAPLRIVKKSASNPSHQAQRLSPPPLQILKKSISTSSCQAQRFVTKSPDRRFSVTASEVFEGDLGFHHEAYTPSEYSRTSEGEPIERQNDTKDDVLWEQLHSIYQPHERRY